MSLTDDGKRRPVLSQLEGLPESAWEDIGLGEEATLVRHRPGKRANEAVMDFGGLLRRGIPSPLQVRA